MTSALKCSDNGRRMVQGREADWNCAPNKHTCKGLVVIQRAVSHVKIVIHGLVVKQAVDSTSLCGNVIAEGVASQVEEVVPVVSRERHRDRASSSDSVTVTSDLSVIGSTCGSKHINRKAITCSVRAEREIRYAGWVAMPSVWKSV